ncbi:MAG: hypothetical protein HOV71_08330 [Hamadaea sp.]|uniref:DUF6186 family protein n=1 Tax=Hamadaea sp. NPDC050747 TaxID=3155789 RepID=UPI001824728E|nr:hypothetical protein [Hamadaea sp.]NUR48123.1 hypothetical protein [Hamadaea sp.]NUT06059.1 hypothetical protein [Hamadaea sp.]
MRMLAIAGFILAGLLVLAVEWAARRTSRIPTLGDLAAVVMTHEVGRIPVGRIAVFGFWWWVGWHFLAR